MALVAGAEYRSYAEFTAALKLYETANFANYYHALSIKLGDEYPRDIRDDFIYRRLKLKCKYGGNVRRTNKENLRKTSSYKTDCRATISIVYKPKKKWF